ncbi:hypothetical protein ABPG75_004595 [Micractinium tetrahymenae]
MADVSCVLSSLIATGSLAMAEDSPALAAEGSALAAAAAVQAAEALSCIQTCADLAQASGLCGPDALRFAQCWHLIVQCGPHMLEAPQSAVVAPRSQGVLDAVQGVLDAGIPEGLGAVKHAACEQARAAHKVLEFMSAAASRVWRAIAAAHVEAAAEVLQCGSMALQGGPAGQLADLSRRGVAALVHACTFQVQAPSAGSASAVLTVGAAAEEALCQALGRLLAEAPPLAARRTDAGGATRCKPPAPGPLCLCLEAVAACPPLAAVLASRGLLGAVLEAAVKEQPLHPAKVSMRLALNTARAGLIMIGKPCSHADWKAHKMVCKQLAAVRQEQRAAESVADA